MTDSLLHRLARALETCASDEWRIDGPNDGKIVVLHHRSDVALQIDRGHRKGEACRLFVETEVLHSGKGLGGFRQTRPEVVRTWMPFGMLPLPAKLPEPPTAMRDALVSALDRAIGPAAERRLQSARARLALDLAPFRDDRQDPQGIGWHLSLEANEIYGPRKTLTIADDAALADLRALLRDVCIMRHGKMERIVNVGIPECNSAHARAEAAATATEGGLTSPLSLSLD